MDEANILGPHVSECPKTPKGTVLALKLHLHFKRRRRKNQVWWQTPEVPTVQEAKASLGKVRREREGRRKEGKKLKKSYNPITLDRYKIVLESFKCLMFPLRRDLLWSTGPPRTTFGSFPGLLACTTTPILYGAVGGDQAPSMLSKHATNQAISTHCL